MVIAGQLGQTCLEYQASPTKGLNRCMNLAWCVHHMHPTSRQRKNLTEVFNDIFCIYVRLYLHSFSFHFKEKRYMHMHQKCTYFKWNRSYRNGFCPSVHLFIRHTLVLRHYICMHNIILELQSLN